MASGALHAFKRSIVAYFKRTEHSIRFIALYTKPQKNTKDSMFETTHVGDVVYQTIETGPLACNCTIIGNKVTKEAIVVDAGGDVDKIVSAAQNLGLQIKRTYHTHGHFDHILASCQLREKTKCELYLHKDDLDLWDNLQLQLNFFGMPSMNEIVKGHRHPDHLLRGDESASVNGLSGQCIHTPGHTPGSICFYFQLTSDLGVDHRLLLSGDTLFKDSIGRTDFWKGSMPDITNSIQEKLYILPDDTKVIPGHGEATTIGRERKMNKVIRDKNLSSNSFNDKDTADSQASQNSCCSHNKL